jgi:drug/metabolite transporter (DMT)-like permease
MPLRALFARLPATIRGMLLMLISTLCMAGMNGVIRYLTAELHPFEIAFFRNFFSVLLFVPLVMRRGFAPLRTTKIHLHVVRGVLNITSMLSFFFALKIEQLAKVTALNFTTPLFASLLAIVMLREKARIGRWLGLGVGLSGALLILRPGAEPLSLGSILVLISSFIWCIALVDIKVMTRTESSTTIALYAALFMVPLSLAAALLYWTWPTWEQLAWLAVVGGLATIGQLCLGEAFTQADVTTVLPVDFTKLIWAALIGIFAFAEFPDLWTMVGGAVIAGSVIYVAYLERADRRPTVPAKA